MMVRPVSTDHERSMSDDDRAHIPPSPSPGSTGTCGRGVLATLRIGPYILPDA
jgi:hypothetical protein